MPEFSVLHAFAFKAPDEPATTLLTPALDRVSLIEAARIVT